MHPTVVIEDVTESEAFHPSPVFATPPGSTNSDHEYESLDSESDEDAQDTLHHSSETVQPSTGIKEESSQVWC